MTDEQIEVVVSNVLRVGVTASSLCVLAGLISVLIETPAIRGFHHFRPAAEAWPGWHGEALIWTGLWLLFFTPVMRVAFTVFAFGVQRDRFYVGTTLLVLAVLLYSLLYGN